MTTPEQQAVNAQPSYRVLISVQRGLHCGAAFIGQRAQGLLVGHAAACDVVLMDSGVQAQCLRVFERGGLLAAEVLGPGVLHRGEVLAPGLTIFDEPLALVQVGDAELRIELIRRSRRQHAPLEGAEFQRPALPAEGRRTWASFTLAGLFIAALLGVAGGVVSASSGRQDSPKEGARTLAAIVEGINARGAQVVVAIDAHGRPLLRGRVADAAMRSSVEQEIRAAGLTVGLQLHDVRQMADSLSRLARLTGHQCDLRYLGDGRFECELERVSAQAFAQLQGLIAQIPGIEALGVRARVAEPAPPLPLSPRAPEVAAPEPPVQPALPYPVIRHVAIIGNRAMAIDASSRRLHVGDNIDGAKVLGIEFDTIHLLSGSHRYTVRVAPELASASSPHPSDKGHQ